MTRLLLVRHGQSTWNVIGRWQGRADPPLSEAGEAQARAAAAALGPVDGMWSSDLIRARRTAELLAPRGVRVRLDSRLRERDVGAWTALTRHEIEARDPRWLEDGRRPEGWEPDAALVARAVPALQEVVEALGSEGTGIVVSHGGVIRAVAQHLGAEPAPVPNLGGVGLHVDGAAFVLGARTSLLDGPATPSPPFTTAD
jgi:glucosyl-3-phosphoglycerate phosphatase